MTGMIVAANPEAVLATQAAPARRQLGAAYNVTKRVNFRGGWIGLFSGESQGKALTRALTEMNADGYRVAFVVNDRWSFVRYLLEVVVIIITLGFVARSPNLLIIGEPA